MTIFRGGAVQIPPSPYRRYQMVSSFLCLKAERGAGIKADRCRGENRTRPLPVAEKGSVRFCEKQAIGA